MSLCLDPKVVLLILTIIITYSCSIPESNIRFLVQIIYMVGVGCASSRVMIVQSCNLALLYCCVKGRY